MNPIRLIIVAFLLFTFSAGCSSTSEPLEPLGETESSVTAPAPRPLPAFEMLWAAYPTGEVEDVKNLIGGGVDAKWITNTCAIRLSRSLNESGSPVPPGVASASKGLHTVKGADGKNYAFRLAEFRQYMLRTYGAPTFTKQSPRGATGVDPAAFAGKKGIILFDVRVWEDATGHVDLWDGTRAAHDEYFALAAGVQIWETN